MGLKFSKIPQSDPGQILMYTGIEEIDKFYKELERPIKKLSKLRSNLDLRFTELIHHLGADNLWEFNCDFEVILRMIFTVLATFGRGDLDSISKLELSSPYIVLKPGMKHRKTLRNLIEKYYNFIDAVENLSTILESINIKSDAIETSKALQYEIPLAVIKQDYSIKEKITAIGFANKNHFVIEKSPEEVKELKRISIEVPSAITKIINESRYPPFSDILIQRGVQASSDSLNSCKDIVSKFWPIV